MSHLIVWQVILPLGGAPVAFLLWQRARCRALMLLIAVLMLLISIALAKSVFGGVPIQYFLGGWAAPYGIEYRVDRLTAFILLVINTVHLGAAIYCLQRSDWELSREAQPIFYSAWLLCIAGLNGMVVTNDAFNVFVFLEISSLSTYLLISAGRDPRALLAAYRYLVVGAIGATFFLLAIGLVYMQTGTLNITDLAIKLNQAHEPRVMLIALAFLVLGLGIKSAAFPLHSWLPNAYCFAPAPVTVLLSGTATKVSLYVLIRFTHDIFGAHYSFVQMPVPALLIISGIAALLITPLLALRETNIKRMFAWSSVAQIGYILIAIGLGTQAGTTAALLHLLNHSIIKAAVFVAVGILIMRTTSGRIDQLGGVAHRYPILCYAILFCGLSLIGIPGTVGFVSKWYLLQAIFADTQWWWVAIPVVIGSLGSAAYVWRLVEVMWAKPQVDIQQESWLDDCRDRTLSVAEWLPLGGLLLLSLWLGLNASGSVELATSAAAALMEVQP